MRLPVDNTQAENPGQKPFISEEERERLQSRFGPGFIRTREETVHPPQSQGYGGEPNLGEGTRPGTTSKDRWEAESRLEARRRVENIPYALFRPVVSPSLKFFDAIASCVKVQEFIKGQHDRLIDVYEVVYVRLNPKTISSRKNIPASETLRFKVETWASVPPILPSLLAAAQAKFYHRQWLMPKIFMESIAHRFLAGNPQPSPEDTNAIA